MKLKALTQAIILGLVILGPSILVGVTMSDFPPDPEGEYSPWADLNDDGEINIFDIVWLATRYEEMGIPVNKTALLYSINDTFAELLAMIDGLNSTVIEQQTIINNLNNTVNNLNSTVTYLNNTVTYLNETVTYLNGSGLGAPDYDSGWLNISDKRGQYFSVDHYLNNSDILVEITGKSSLDNGVHQRNLGNTAFEPGWRRTYGLGGASEECQAIIETRDGGYVLAGARDGYPILLKTDYYGNQEWLHDYPGPGRVNAIIQTSDGGFAIAGKMGSDGLLLRVDSDGNYLWYLRYLEGSPVEFRDIIATSDGNFTMVGNIGSDVLLIKVYPNGTKIWSQVHGGVGGETGQVLVEISGGYAFAGDTASFGASGRDFWLVETDEWGLLDDHEYYGGTGDEVAFSLVKFDDGSYAIGGITDSFGNGEYDFWLVKTENSTLDESWNQTYGGNKKDILIEIKVTRDDGYVMTGYTNSSGTWDFWVVKTNERGWLQWNNTYGGVGEDRALGIIETRDDGYVIAGLTNSYGAGGIDFWLVKTDIESGLVRMDSTTDTITLYRGSTDNDWNYVRVLIWKIPQP